MSRRIEKNCFACRHYFVCRMRIGVGDALSPLILPTAPSPFGGQRAFVFKAMANACGWFDISRFGSGNDGEGALLAVESSLNPPKQGCVDCAHFCLCKVVYDVDEALAATRNMVYPSSIYPSIAAICLHGSDTGGLDSSRMMTGAIPLHPIDTIGDPTFESLFRNKGEEG